MTFIYILQLENNKYYIGKTNKPDIRIEQHCNDYGSAWTRKYKPIKVIEIIPHCDIFDEDKYTLKYMEKYGINNVRGGSFCEINLDKNNIETIKKMINSSKDQCYFCGMKGHFANKCDTSEYEFIDVCDRCGREGHNEDECYAKTDVDGYSIDVPITVYYCSYCDKEFDTLKGATCHENLYCKKKDTCYRCGREGHYSNKCYAKKHINGQYIKN